MPRTKNLKEEPVLYKSVNVFTLLNYSRQELSDILSHLINIFFFYGLQMANIIY